MPAGIGLPQSTNVGLYTMNWMMTEDGMHSAPISTPARHNRSLRFLCFLPSNQTFRLGAKINAGVASSFWYQFYNTDVRQSAFNVSRRKSATCKSRPSKVVQTPSKVFESYIDEERTIRKVLRSWRIRKQDSSSSLSRDIVRERSGVDDTRDLESWDRAYRSINLGELRLLYQICDQL